MDAGLAPLRLDLHVSDLLLRVGHRDRRRGPHVSGIAAAPNLDGHGQGERPLVEIADPFGRRLDVDPPSVADDRNDRPGRRKARRAALDARPVAQGHGHTAGRG